MTRLLVACSSFHSDEMAQVPVPFEVRTRAMRFVARGVTNHEIDIAPGQYVVTARLPAGQVARGEVVIREEGQQKVDLRLPSEDISPSERQEVLRFVRDTGERPSPEFQQRILQGVRREDIREELDALSRQIIVDARGLRAATWGGDPLGEIRRLPTPEIHQAPHSAPEGMVELIATAKLRVLQLVENTGRSQNLVLPTSTQSHEQCRIVFRRLFDHFWSVSVHPEKLLADLILQFGARGNFDAVATYGGQFDIKKGAEELLLRKKHGPIAAAIGAYALLRTGQLDRLRDWTHNLLIWFDWLPDAVPIRVEHLARLGRHSEAWDVLVHELDRGLPMFSEGLTIMIDRLRYYINLPGKALRRGDKSDAERLLSRLEQFAAFCEFSSESVTYSGSHPARPGIEEGDRRLGLALDSLLEPMPFLTR